MASRNVLGATLTAADVLIGHGASARVSGYPTRCGRRGAHQDGLAYFLPGVQCHAPGECRDRRIVPA